MTSAEAVAIVTGKPAVTGKSRPAIPDPLKRSVRQRCGFGCVVCGFPLYHYEHMIPYHVVKAHDLNNITLLCDRHHREKTSGLLPLQDLRVANADPVNLRGDHSTPLSLHYSGANCESKVGPMSHRWPVLPDGGLTVALLVDDIPIVAFARHDEQLLLTVQLFDEHNEHIVQILDNELTYSLEPWDIEMVSRHLTIRNAPRNIFVRMEFTPPSLVNIERGHVYCNGYELKISPEHFDTGRGTVRGLSTVGSFAGVAIGDTGSAPFGVGLPATQKAYAPFKRPVRVIKPANA